MGIEDEPSVAHRNAVRTNPRMYAYGHLHSTMSRSCSNYMSITRYCGVNGSKLVWVFCGEEVRADVICFIVPGSHSLKTPVAIKC